MKYKIEKMVVTLNKHLHKLETNAHHAFYLPGSSFVVELEEVVAEYTTTDPNNTGRLSCMITDALLAH